MRGHPVCVRAQVRSLMKDSTLGGMYVKQMISQLSQHFSRYVLIKLYAESLLNDVFQRVSYCCKCETISLETQYIIHSFINKMEIKTCFL